MSTTAPVGSPLPSPLPVAGGPPPGRSRMGRLERACGGRAGLIGASVLALLILVAIAAPLLAPYPPDQIDGTRVLAGPDWAHPFGSDALGRDVLSRVLFAFRTSLASAIGAVLLAAVAGVPIGLLAGYRGGLVDTLLMRPVDMLLALPALLLAVTLIAILGPGSWVATIAIAVIYMPILARVLRSSVLAIRERPYVIGARARGRGDLSVMVRHVLPNAAGPVLVQATVLMGFALQVEAALAFLGLGAQPPTPSLGLMLLDGYQVLQQAWWVDVFPGLAIAVTVVAFLLIGDGLRRRYDATAAER
jgi:peptide/nickel transport system permease protein